MSGESVARAPGAVMLAVGIVALEFAAAVASFVASTLLPVVTGELGARDQLALLVAGSTLGLFVALPLSGQAVRTLGARGTLGIGIVAYVGGLVVAATARHAWVFALGQLAAGLASGLLAVFGVSSAIRHLDEALRVRVVAASSAMWILPAMVGPAATLGLEHLIGWRWTLLVPVPVVLAGRVLIVRATRDEPPGTGEQRPLGRTLLVPIGVAGIVFGADWWPIAMAGAVVALAGVTAIMPAGTGRLTRGTPAALAAMTLFAIGYFGADSLITVLLTDAYRTSLGQAAVVLSAAPLAWALTSLVVLRFVRGKAKARFPVVGLSMSTLGVLSVAVSTMTTPTFTVALAGWTVAGVGVGLAYPALYILSTTAGTSTLDAAELATAVITAEAFGGLLGRAAGGAISSLGGAGLGAAYVLFAAALATGVFAATRTAAAHRAQSRAVGRRANLADRVPRFTDRRTRRYLTMPPYDPKREFKEFYAPKNTGWELVDVPEQQFIAIDGSGNPNTASEYTQAVQALYAVAYTIKFASKRGDGRDFVVAPLEGLWWADEPEAFTTGAKDSWHWTMLVNQPGWITETAVEEAKTVALAKKKLPAIAGIRRQTLNEGRSAQVLHVGPYDDEAPILAHLHHEYLAAHELEPVGLHHEIYLGDPRKTEPAKLKTILRQPVHSVARVVDAG